MIKDIFKPPVKKTLLHNIDPRTKIITSLIFMIISIGAQTPIVQITIITIFMVQAVIAKALKATLKIMITALPFFLMILVANYFLGGLPIEISLTAALRLYSLIAIFTLFFLTTDPDDISEVLDKLKFPPTISLSFTLAIRFLPTTAKQISDIMDAQRSRGLELESKNLLQRIKNLLPIMIPVIILSIKKSIEVAEALETRGLNLKVKRTSITQLKVTMKDYIYTITNIIIAFFLILIIT